MTTGKNKENFEKWYISYAQHSFEHKGCKVIMNGDSLGLFNTMNEAYNEAFKTVNELINQQQN